MSSDDTPLMFTFEFGASMGNRPLDENVAPVVGTFAMPGVLATTCKMYVHTSDISESIAMVQPHDCLSYARMAMSAFWNVTGWIENTSRAIVRLMSS